MFDECKKEEEEEEEEFGYKKDYYDYTSRIMRKVYHLGTALCINIYIDIEKCVELVMINICVLRSIGVGKILDT